MKIESYVANQYAPRDAFAFNHIIMCKCKTCLVLEKLSHLSILLMAVILCGPHERRLINDLMRSYKTLERPVANESDAVVLKFGLTLQQIMDVVSLTIILKRFN